MTMIPTASWYHDLLKAAEEMHGDRKDRIGRPWYQHFERVALRVLFRDLLAYKASVQAALMHDALMAGGRGAEWLRDIGCEERAVDIVRLITPPPHANYFRQMDAVTPADNAIYLEYIRGLAASGDERAMHVKLADLNDTIDAFREATLPVLKTQLRERYVPSRDILQLRLEKS